MKWSSNPTGTGRPAGRKTQVWRLAGGIALVMGVAAASAPVHGRSDMPAEPMTLAVGTARVLEHPVPLKRMSLANPEVADAIVLSPREIYLTAKSPGRTTLALWDQSGRISATYEITVTPDLERLKQQLAEFLPEETGIELGATIDRITLRGTVSSEARHKQVVALAEAYAPQRVIDLLTIAPSSLNSAPPTPAYTVEVIRGLDKREVRFESGGHQ